MAVYVSNITIPVGSDFQQTFTLNSVNNAPLDLTGYSGSAVMKKHPASLTLSAIFDVSFPDRLNGKIRISLASSMTSYLRPGRYSYDILLDSGTSKNRVIEGSAIVTPGVTNPIVGGTVYSPTIGTQGIQGIQGPPGPQGIQGIPGLFAGQGIQGVQGFGGTQGTQGAQGVDGAFAGQGIQGRQGIQGIQGPQGTQGIQGIQGRQGTQGLQGIQGRQGIQGTSGMQGILGTQGTQGTQGGQGGQGIQGLQGIQGRFGNQGIQGTDGAFAGQGIQGIQGFAGSQGLQGTDGQFVAQGIQGIQGAQGTQGIPGIFQRVTSTQTTGTIGAGSTANITFNGYKSYLLYKVTTSSQSWITIYTDSDSRTADSSRSQTSDPLPGSGVIAEFISTGATTFLATPAIVGFNNDASPSTNIYAKIVNTSGISTDITTSLTILQIEV